MIRKFLLATLILVTIGLVGCAGSGGYGPGGSYVVPYLDANYEVPPGRYVSLTVDMREGAVFEGYMTIRGANNDIRLKIVDSYNHEWVNMLVVDRYDFSFTAKSSGFHTIYLDNTMSIVTTKQVFIHYRIR